MSRLSVPALPLDQRDTFGEDEGNHVLVGPRLGADTLAHGPLFGDGPAAAASAGAAEYERRIITALECQLDEIVCRALRNKSDGAGRRVNLESVAFGNERGGHRVEGGNGALYEELDRLTEVVAA